MSQFRKSKRQSHSRRRGRNHDEEEEEEDAEEIEDRILSAKFEQKLKKRSKGLVAATEGVIEEEKEEEEGVPEVGYAFMKQSTTTDLDRARERFVEEQIERIRNGLEPIVPTPAAPEGDSKFVSGGFQVPDSRMLDSKFVGSSRMVPEIDLDGSDAQRQYDQMKELLEERRRLDEIAKLSEPSKEKAEPVRIVNYNAQSFNQ